MIFLSASRSWLAILAISLVVSAGAAENGVPHNRYKWRDATGNLHYSDGLPPEAAKYGYEVIGPQGVVIRHVDRAMTADEVAIAKKERASQQAAQVQHDDARRADVQLLSGYSSEAELKRAQAQKLALLDQQINAAQSSLHSQEQSLADLLARAADSERDGTALSDAETGEITRLRKQVDVQRLAIQRRQAERTNASAAFDREAERYRELKAAVEPPKS